MDAIYAWWKVADAWLRQLAMQWERKVFVLQKDK